MRTNEEKQFEPPHEEFVRRIFYSMVSAALELAADEEMSVAETIHWIETAYFHVLRERGLKMREISTHLDVSTRKTAKLADQLKQNFFDPDREHTLPRRIEFMLWSEPLSRSRLLQLLEPKDRKPWFEEHVVRRSSTVVTLLQLQPEHAGPKVQENLPKCDALLPEMMQAAGLE